MTRNVFAVVFVLGVTNGSVAYAQFHGALQFAADDEHDGFSQPLGRDLVIRIRRAVDAHGHAFGWDFEVVDRRLPRSPNFFYECLCGHGPRPHDLYAWHFVQDYFPSERILPIYGYPYEVRVSCVDCTVAGTEGTEIRFIAGTVHVDWRRVSTAFPRQQRFSSVW